MAKGKIKFAGKIIFNYYNNSRIDVTYILVCLYTQCMSINEYF